jgi:hypothetical protein
MIEVRGACIVLINGEDLLTRMRYARACPYKSAGG